MGWFRDLYDRATGAPEPRAIGQLRTIAQERGGHVNLADMDDGRCLARIEWLDDSGMIVGGEARDSTPQRAATQLLLSLRLRGVI